MLKARPQLPYPILCSRCSCRRKMQGSCCCLRNENRSTLLKRAASFSSYRYNVTHPASEQRRATVCACYGLPVLSSTSLSPPVQPLSQFLDAWKIIPGILCWLLSIIDTDHRFSGVTPSLTLPQNAPVLRQEVPRTANMQKSLFTLSQSIKYLGLLAYKLLGTKGGLLSSNGLFAAVGQHVCGFLHKLPGLACTPKPFSSRLQAFYYGQNIIYCPSEKHIVCISYQIWQLDNPGIIY